MSEELPFLIPCFRAADYARKLFERLGISFEPPVPLGEGKESYEASTRPREEIVCTQREWVSGAERVLSTERHTTTTDADGKGWSEHFSATASVIGLPGAVLRLEGSGDRRAEFTSFFWEGDAPAVREAWLAVLGQGPISSPLWLTHPTLPAAWVAEAAGLSWTNAPLTYELSPASNDSMNSWPGLVVRSGARCAGVLLRKSAASADRMVALPLGPLPLAAEGAKPPFLYFEAAEPLRQLPPFEVFFSALCGTTREPHVEVSGTRVTADLTPAGFLGCVLFGPADEAYRSTCCEGWRLRSAEVSAQHLAGQSPRPADRQLALQRDDGHGFALFLEHATATSYAPTRIFGRLIADQETTREVTTLLRALLVRFGWTYPHGS